MKTTIATAILIALILNVVAQEPSAKPPFGLPKDAKLFNGKWYAVVPAKVDWKIAKQRCEQSGGQLAVLKDEVTFVFVHSLTNSAVWLGATDEAMEGDWKWIDGTKVTINKWAPGQPNNLTGADNYMTMIKGELHDYHAKWDKVRATPVVGYICEWKQK